MSQSLSDFEVTERDPYVGLVLADRYRMIRKLGGGGMGAVYEAEHVMIGRRVAVKVLHAQFAHDADVVRRFMNEARAAAMLHHKNILECTDVGQHTDGSPFLVLGLLRGRSLADEIAKGTPLSVGRAVRIVMQIGSALAAAHAKGIVHRDMKPDNVFLEEGDDLPPDHVRVLDFGISKFSNTMAGGTKTGSMLGTPYYMSPEQFNDASKVDHRSDVYSVSAILYEALSGSVPFDSPTFPGIMMKVLTAPTPEVRELRPDVPEALSAVIHRGMAKELDQRFQSIGELTSAIAPFANLDAAPVLAGPPPRRFETRHSYDATLAAPPAPASEPSTLASSHVRAVRSRNRGLQLAAGALVLVGAVGAAAYVALRSPGNEAGGRAGMPGTPTTSPAPPPTVDVPTPAPVPASAHLHVASPHTSAVVTFRGQTHPLPFDGDVRASETPELLEVRAPGRVSRRYGLRIADSVSLFVELERGEGSRIATDAELALALAGIPVGVDETTPSTDRRPRPRADSDHSNRAPALLPP